MEILLVRLSLLNLYSSFLSHVFFFVYIRLISVLLKIIFFIMKNNILSNRSTV